MPYLGELSALLTACLWSGSSIAFASATKRAGVYQVNFTRLVLATFFLALFIAFSRNDTTVSATQAFNLAVSGVVGIGLGDTFLFAAYRRIGARITMLIMSLAPSIAALLGYVMLGEEISSAAFWGIALTTGGISLVLSGKDPAGVQTFHASPGGIGFGFLAAVGQGAGLVFAKKAFLEAPLDGAVATSVRILASIALLLPYVATGGRFARMYRAFQNDKRAFTLTTVGALLGPTLGITFSLIAVEYTKVGIAATIMALAPILMLPLVRIIYREHLTWRSIAGTFVAVVGVAMLFIR